ncbi:serine protease inhibitor 28Dc-like [Anopheles marshallii]|uniref:serine protease inhibitor 28Dc-like n=1 Tax=Anopheles marshallii TaxID=1521116 RepID=UPI00237A1E25|nr:serine protease inhibitor 28Dc-like [Anopheles marshallii]
MPYGAIASVKIPFGLWFVVLVGGVMWCGANAQNYNAPSKAVSEQLVAAINDLARKLGQQLGASGGNSSKTELFSPVSIGSMMFLLLRAANRDTRYELLNVLQLEQFRAANSGNIPKNFARLLKEFTHDIAGRGILEELPEWHTSSSCYPRMEGFDYEDDDDDDKYLDEPIQPNVVQLANGIFLQQGLMNSTNFVRLAKELYQAQIEQVNFKDQPHIARATINHWVNESTRGRIEEILPDDLDTSTQMVIANALYFKATWETFFNEPQFTRDQPFFPDGEDQPAVMVPTMFASGCFPYYASPELNARIMAFPYRNRTTSMYIILPNDSNRAKVRQLQAQLSSAALDQLIGRMRLQKAIVQFPRMHATNTYDLKRALQQLGLRTLFDRTKNNLKIAASNGRSGSEGRSRKLYVSEMVHKIDLDVNERGTEGGAVTITAMERSLPPVNFRARGPFILAIRHDPTKMLLFYGAVFDPS